MIYFCDAKFDYIARTNLDFTEFTTIFNHEQGEAHVFSISIFEDFIYFSDWKNQKKIFRIHKYCDDGNGEEKLRVQIESLKAGVLVRHLGLAREVWVLTISLSPFDNVS